MSQQPPPSHVNGWPDVHSSTGGEPGATVVTLGATQRRRRAAPSPGAGGAAGITFLEGRAMDKGQKPGGIAQSRPSAVPT